MARRALALVVTVLLSSSALLAASAGPAAAFLPPAGWSGPAVLPRSSAGDIGDAHFVRTAAGGLAAVWAADQLGFADDFLVSTSDPSDGWSYPRTVATVSGSDTGMHVAFDQAPDGSAAAVWEYIYAPSAPRIIQAQVRGTDGAWGAAVNVNSTVTGYFPRVVALGAGNFLALWAASNGTDSWMASSLWSSGTWGPAVTLLPPSQLTFGAFDLQRDGVGGAFAVWAQGNLSVAAASASHFTAAGGWATPFALGTSGSLGDYLLAADGQGGAFVAWSSSESDGLHVFASRYTPASGWLATTTLGAPLTATFIALSAAPGPRATIAWWDYDWANETRTLGGATWGASGWTALSSPPAAFSTYGLAAVHLALRADGTGLAAFSVLDGESVNHLYVAALDSTRWLDAVEVHEGGPLVSPQVFAWAGGRATVAGTLFEAGGVSLVTFSYVPPDTTPPVLLVGAPASGSTTDNPNTVVEGASEPGASVWVNGAAVEVDENGGFSVVVWLSPGANTIYVATADAAGNRDETSVGVTYTDPAAGVEQALATAQADLSQAQADLSQAQADLSEAQAHILLLELQQNQTTNTLRDATADNVALAGQVTTLSIVAFASLIAGIGALGLALVMARRGTGGEGGGSAERVYSKRKFSEQELEEKKQG